MRFLEKSSSERQKVEWWLPGAGERGNWGDSYCLTGACLVTQTVESLPAMKETWVCFLGWEDSPGILPQEFHGQRKLAGYSPWICKESDTTERLVPSFFHFCCLMVAEFHFVKMKKFYSWLPNNVNVLYAKELCIKKSTVLRTSLVVQGFRTRAGDMGSIPCPGGSHMLGSC